MNRLRVSFGMPILLVAVGVTAGAQGCVGGDGETDETYGSGEVAVSTPVFERVQPELFSTAGAQPLAWADYDRDGDLDVFVGFRGERDRLYRNDEGRFVDVARDLGLAHPEETRAASWGDWDGDGDPDLAVGFSLEGGRPTRVYRNEGAGLAFADATASLGLELEGTTRQMSWVDYDGDGDLDFFVAFRDRPNRMFRNEGPGRPFTDVTEETGLGDPRRTVGVSWFDMDEDGDLDVFVANQNGDSDAVYRNDASQFTDVALDWGLGQALRQEDYGGVGPAVADYDGDGDLDLFVANYGPDALWRNEGGGEFQEVAGGTVLGQDYHSTAAAWGDFDQDGWPDLFVVSYLSGVAEVEDHLFRNGDGHFSNVIPDYLQHPGASHGVSWVDFDKDGDLDLMLANNHPEGGGHPLYRNRTRTQGASVQVLVMDSLGAHRFPGAEVRVYRTPSRDADEEDRPAAAETAARRSWNPGEIPDPGLFIGAGLVDSGGGYCSQSDTPVHIAVPKGIRDILVEVTVATNGVRRHFVQGPIRIPSGPTQWIEIRLPEDY